MKTAPTLRRHLLAWSLAASMVGLVGHAHAQTYPERPIKIVVGFAPGGATDILMRQISNELGAALGQPIVVENRGGGNGYPAWNGVAKSPADGYTLLLGENSMAIMPSLYKSQTFQPAKDLAPIGFLGTAPFMLVVHPSVKAQSLKEFVDLAKQNPGQVKYGSAGNGTPTQLSFEVLKLTTGIDALHIPYKGGGPAMADLLGGHIASMFAAFSVGKPVVEQGKVRALALTGKKRSAALPDLPTFEEAGVPLPDLDLGQWWGLFTPVGTPPDVVSKLNKALNDVLANPEVKKRLAGLSIEPEPGNPQLLHTRLNAELERWAHVIRRAKVVAD